MGRLFCPAAKEAAGVGFQSLITVSFWFYL
jgi:hypothetical protein